MPSLQDVALLVKRLQNHHHRQLDAALREIGLTLVQWDALRHLARHPEASLHDLAQLTFQSDQAFGTLAGRMVDRGLVERAAGSGRAVRLEMTPKGQALLGEAAAIVDRTLADSLGTLPQAQLDTLHGLLASALGVTSPSPTVGDETGDAPSR